MAKRLAHTLKTLIRGKRATRGESLVEVLTSIVIGGLALLMLGMAIASSSHMAMDSRDAMGKYYEAGNAIASGSATSLGAGTVALAQQDGTSLALVNSGETIQATYYQSDSLGSAAVVLYESGATTPAGGGA